MNDALLRSLVLFIPVAAILTITPGTDTVLVLRSAVGGGRAAGMRASLGIALGCVVWAALAAFGLAALVAASTAAFALLKYAGAAYLLWLGVMALLCPRSALRTDDGAAPRNGFVDGLLTNLLNPKVGVFYVSFLPQFVPAHLPVAQTVLLLGAVHAALSLVWLCVLAMAAASMVRVLQRPAFVRVIDRVAGAVLIAFGVRLAASSQP